MRSHTKPQRDDSHETGPKAAGTRPIGNRAMNELVQRVSAAGVDVRAVDPAFGEVVTTQRVLTATPPTTTTTPTTAPALPGSTVTPPTVTPPKRSVVKEGDGPTEEIGQLQQRLTAVGNRVSVTGMFDAATTAAVTAFQTAHAPLLTPTGTADLKTWAELDRLAPTLKRNGLEVVDVAGGANEQGAPLGTITHPTIRAGATGAGVRELQQRLGQAPTVTAKPAVTGTFDEATDAAVREFQRTNKPLSVDGVVGNKTWARIDAVCLGPIDQGRESTEQHERVEGQEFIARGNYSWQIDDTAKEIRVTVNINFTENPTHAKVADWIGDIKEQWNKFQLVDKADPARVYKMVFDPVAGGTPPDTTVAVDTTPFDPANPDRTRSNAGRFFTVDTRKSLAPHEFGHLIGLADEYNSPEEQYKATTGEQVEVGDVGNTYADGSGVHHARATPESIAHDLGRVLRSSPAATRPQRLKAITDANGMNPGGFARRVANAYRAEFGGKMKKGTLVKSGNKYIRQYRIDSTADIADDITARLPGRTTEQVAVTAVFLETNVSLMGDMSSVNSTTGAPVAPHDHPVQPRHVRHFAKILTKNRTGDWELRFQ